MDVLGTNGAMIAAGDIEPATDDGTDFGSLVASDGTRDHTFTVTNVGVFGIDAGTLKVGAPADFILIDVDYPWQVKEGDFHSRSHNTAFEGARLAGKVTATYVAGDRVFDLEGAVA